MPSISWRLQVPRDSLLPGFDPESLAVYIVGLIAVPLGELHLRIKAEALEHGTTGARCRCSTMPQ